MYVKDFTFAQATVPVMPRNRRLTFGIALLLHAILLIALMRMAGGLPEPSAANVPDLNGMPW